MRNGLLLMVLLVGAGCGGGSGGGGGSSAAPSGLEQRTAVTGLQFPTGQPQPGALTPVVAFPALSFASPAGLTFAPDGSNRVFVTELDGRVLVFPNNAAVTPAGVAEFLNLTPANGGQLISGGENGLLGLAFHPDYASNGLFYVSYTVNNPPRTRLSRLQVSADPNRANHASETILLEIDQPAGNHNGGCVSFGPDDKLYWSSGDGGNQHDPNERAQDPTFLLGKLLRLNPDGTVPGDNPFVGQPGYRPEIWAIGFRNPWRFSFDRSTGELWLGDVGQFSIEEIDLVTRGANYGWDFFEGTALHEGNADPSLFVPPVYEYSRALGRSVTGGFVYRGPSLASLVGAYVYADFISGQVWALVYDGNQVVRNEAVATVFNPASFGEDAAGELYVCSFDGNVYQFEETAPGPGPGVPQQLSATGLFADVQNLIPTPGLIEYEVNAPLWSDGARKRRWIALPGTSRVDFSPTDAWTFPVGTVLVKHFELDTPTGIRRLETRVLVRSTMGWDSYPYRWNPAQLDADLLASAATETIAAVDANGQGFAVDWFFPGPTDCSQCHTAAAGHVLGVNTRQLNRDFAYPRVRDNQLRAWNFIGLFDRDIGAATQYSALADPADDERDIATRARSYLAANCAQCHRPGGPTPVNMDLRFAIPVAQTNLIGVTATASAGGAPNLLRIDPGSRQSSELWERLRRLDSWRMPPLASHRADALAIELVGAWIDAGAP